MSHIFYCILGYNWRTKFSKIPVMWKKGGWGSTDVFTMKKTSKIAEEGFPKSLNYNNRRVSLNERSAKIKFESCVIKSAIRPPTSPPTSLASATTIIMRHEICAGLSENEEHNTGGLLKRYTTYMWHIVVNIHSGVAYIFHCKNNFGPPEPVMVVAIFWGATFRMHCVDPLALLHF